MPPAWLAASAEKPRERDHRALLREVRPAHLELQTPLAGKRIFIRLREETDYQTKLYEEVAAIVPDPEPRSKGRKSPIPFEAPS